MKSFSMKVLPALVAVMSMMTACGSVAQPATNIAPTPSSVASSQPTVRPTTIAIEYTDEYLLFEGDELGFASGNDRTRKLGLMTKEGKEILPASYTEISISAQGIIFTCETQDPSAPSVYRMFDLDGKQIGKDYSFIESVSLGDDGLLFYRQASLVNMPAVPPYVAYTEDASGKRSYWLLDEKGQPYEEAPYDEIDMYEDSIAMARNGYIYNRAPDGSITKIGNEVVNSYFDGKYQVKNYYIGTHGVKYSLWDKGGNMLAPPEYSFIDVPFPDRYILYKGWHQALTDEQGFLYDETGKLLADNSNSYLFTIEETGQYVGLSYVAETLNETGNMPILDANGKPEPQGIYFVDKDGKRLTEGYKQVEKFSNEQDLQQRAGAGPMLSYSATDGYSRPLPNGDYSKAFYLCVTQQDKLVYHAYSDMLLGD